VKGGGSKRKGVGKKGLFLQTTSRVKNSLCIENEKMTKTPTSRLFKIILKIIDVGGNAKIGAIFAREFLTV
jgi:hypothetical protein